MTLGLLPRIHVTAGAEHHTLLALALLPVTLPCLVGCKGNAWCTQSRLSLGHLGCSQAWLGLPNNDSSELSCIQNYRNSQHV